MPDLFTIGHSTWPAEKFLAMLHRHEITAVADVRSNPFSRWSPQFNRKSLETTLSAANIHYVFLGDELGARRIEPEVYIDGVARYDRIAELPIFQSGLERVRKGAEKFRLALMCAERDPLECHRTILVCRHLRDDFSISHILPDESIEPHADAEQRLLKEENVESSDLFNNTAEARARAYDRRAAKIAYRKPQR